MPSPPGSSAPGATARAGRSSTYPNSSAHNRLFRRRARPRRSRAGTSVAAPNFERPRQRLPAHALPAARRTRMTSAPRRARARATDAERRLPFTDTPELVVEDRSVGGTSARRRRCDPPARRLQARRGVDDVAGDDAPSPCSGRRRALPPLTRADPDPHLQGGVGSA
jgi:hypothetical protein